MYRLPVHLSEHLERGGTLVVPSAQRAHAVRLAHAAAQLAAGARVWTSPDVQSASAWVRRECERQADLEASDAPRLLGVTEEWWLWRAAAADAAREAAGSNPFLSTESLGEALQRSSELAAYWRIALSPGAPDSEARLLLRARRAFVARCAELGATSASERLATLAPGEGPARPLLAGFDVPPPGLVRLAGAAATGAGLASAPATARAVRTADAQAQAETIAAWCRERLEAQPDARLLVMLPGPAAGRERLAALIRGALDPGAVLAQGGASGNPVGIEGGEPLTAQSLPAQALLCLGILAGTVVETEAFGRWLCSPYWGAPGAPARAALAQLLRQRGLAALSLRELFGALQLAPPQLKGAAHELEALTRRAAGLLGEGSATPRRWSEHFEAALAALGFPGALPRESALEQTRLRWRELLEEFGTLAGGVASLERAAAVAALTALAARTAYRPADEDAAVMLSPMLADPVVRYDGIWVASVSADALPQPVAPDAFLPLAAQLAAGVPAAGARQRRAQAQALLSAWARATSDLVLSVPAREADLELLPSPCLAGLELAEPAAGTLWLPLRQHREGCTEGREDARGAAFTSPAPLPGGTRAISLQNECAFRAYAELRLGASAPEEAEPGVPMDQRGLLLHAALQLLWERLRDSTGLGGLDAGTLDAAIADCVARAAEMLQVEVRGRGRGRRARRAPDGQFDLFSVLSPALTRECARARRLIGRLCELERTRPAFTVEATEALAELSLGGGRVRMRLDRIDAVAGGRVVLDYKSGRALTPDWYGERPTYPQLLAYLAALGGEVVALATVNLTAREVRFTGVAATAGVLPRVKPIPAVTGAAPSDWRAQQQRWEALIERLIRAFLAGDARVDPAPGACDYCHLPDLCRIGAQPGAEPPAPADDADE